MDGLFYSLLPPRGYIMTDIEIVRADMATEFLTAERCYIVETWNNSEDPALSIARARVEPGVTTAWHWLDGVIVAGIVE